MKLVGFSPWKRIETCISNPYKGGRMNYMLISNPSSTMSEMESKRARSLSKEGGGEKISSTIDEQPDFVLTTDHQISIIGHKTSKRSIKREDLSLDGQTIRREVPQWTYASGPGDQSSFLPKSTVLEKIGAIVDPNSRSIFSFQTGNSVLKVWNLDDDVNGPDDVGNSEVKRIELPSPAISVVAVPFRRQSHVKIKGYATKSNEYRGGVVGSLSNGQIFSILVTVQRKIKVAFFGSCNKSITSSIHAKYARSSSRNQKSCDNQKHLFSLSGFILNENFIESSQAGQKRKLYDADSLSNKSAGLVTLTTMSLDAENDDTINFIKHSIELSPLSSNGHDELDEQIHATYIRHDTVKVKLPHKFYKPLPNGNGSSSKSTDTVMVTQLDPTHVGLVYKDSTKSWFATILDVRFGERVVEPFRLVKNNLEVVQICGLSTSIIVVLTSDDHLTVYDVRRAIVLHRLDIWEALELNKKEKLFQFNIISHWVNGTLCIIQKNVKKAENDGGCISVSFAKIGIFDKGIESLGNANSKPLLRGSYNLCRAIASSLATASSQLHGISQLYHSPLFEMDDGPNKIFEAKKETQMIATIMKAMPKYDIKNGSTKLQNGKNVAKLGTLFSKVIKELSNKYNIQITCELNGIESQDLLTSLPQKIVDVTIAIALDTIFGKGIETMIKTDATEVLIKCIRTGKFSGRNHFDMASHIISTDVLRSLLFITNKFIREDNERMIVSPLNLITTLLRYCSDAIPEHMLISMVHFVLCHINGDEFRFHWSHFSINETWYCDRSIKALGQRLKMAKENAEKNKNAEKLIKNLENRYATSIQLFYLKKIVTHSKCNGALLRSALREGLTQSRNGEVEVLIHALSKLLHKVCEGGNFEESKPCIDSSCVSHWLSAAIDSNLWYLLQFSKVNKSIESAKLEVSSALSQTKVLLSLEELVKNASSSLESNKDGSTKIIDVTSLPPYSIETLIY